MDSPPEFPFSCPECGMAYQVPGHLSLAKASCGSCGAKFVLPDFPDKSGRTTPLHPAVTPSQPSPVPPAIPRQGGLLKSLLLVLTGAGLVFAVSVLFQPNSPPGITAPADALHPPEVPAPAPDSTLSPFAGGSYQSRTTGPSGNSSLSLEEPDPSPPSPPSPAIPDNQPDPTPGGESPSPAPAVTLVPDPDPPPATPAPAPVPFAGMEPSAPGQPASPSEAPALAGVTGSSAYRKDSRSALQHFLQAASLAERLAVSLQPDKILSGMQAFHSVHPIVPLPLTDLAFLTEDQVPGTGKKLHLYNVFLSDRDAPIPVAVEETADGYRVDWQAFAESYAHQLRAYFAMPQEASGRFRVLLRRAHYFGPPVPGQDTDRICYNIDPPMRDETFQVWVDRDSAVFREKLAAGGRTGWATESYVIVELAWRGDDRQGRWVGLQKIVSDNWRSP